MASVRVRKRLLAALLGRRRRESRGIPDAAQSTLVPSAFEVAGDGVTEVDLDVHAADALGNPLAGLATTIAQEIVRADPSQCAIIVQSSGDVDTEYGVSFLIKDFSGNPIPDVAAADIGFAIDGAGNTLGTLSGRTNSQGLIGTTWESSEAAVKTFTATIDGVAFTTDAECDLSGGAVAPDIEVDFDADYADIAAVNADSGSNKTFAAAETGGPWSQFDRQSLPASLGGLKALRFTYPDRTTFVAPDYPDGADSLRCADFYIIRAMTDFFADNAPVTEAWVEIPFSFSGPLGDPLTAFTTKSPSAWGCTSNADYKWVFLTTNSTRFSWKVGYAGLYYDDDDTLVAEGATATQFRWDPTAPGQGDGDNNFIGPNVFDGALHTLRIQAKVGPGGIQRLWLDGVLLYEATGLTTTGQTQINKLSLGNNLNQGPGRECHVEYYAIRIWINGNDPGWA